MLGGMRCFLALVLLALVLALAWVRSERRSRFQDSSDVAGDSSVSEAVETDLRQATGRVERVAATLSAGSTAEESVEQVREVPLYFAIDFAGQALDCLGYDGLIEFRRRRVYPPDGVIPGMFFDRQSRGRVPAKSMKMGTGGAFGDYAYGPWIHEALPMSGHIALEDGLWEVALSGAANPVAYRWNQKSWFHHIPTTDVLFFLVDEIALVEGIVRDANGTPVVGARIVGARGGAERGTTDARGYFDVRTTLSEGEVALKAMGPDAMGTATVTVECGVKEWIEIQLDQPLQRAGLGSLELQVVGAPYEYVANLVFLATAEVEDAPDPSRVYSRHHFSRSTKSLAEEGWRRPSEGWVSFEDQAEAWYAVVVRPDTEEFSGYSEVVGAVRVVNDEDQRVKLEYQPARGPLLRGRILTGDRKRLSGSLVLYRLDSETGQHVRTDATGSPNEFQFGLLEPGDYRLALHLQRNLPPTAWQVSVSSGSVTTAEFTLAGGAVEAWPGGDERAHHLERLELRRSGQPPKGELVRYAPLRHGRYRFSWIPDGDYWLMGDGIETRWPVAVRGGQLASVNLPELSQR